MTRTKTNNAERDDSRQPPLAQARSETHDEKTHVMAQVMSDEVVDQIAARFRLLGEPVRLKLLAALAEHERNVGDLVALTGAGQANVSKHLAAMAQGGLVRRRKVGTSTYYAVADESALTLCDVVCAGLQEHLTLQAHAIRIARNASKR